MKRILSDTNFYGLLSKDEERLKVVEKIKTSSKIVIYGFNTIRNELRDVPKLIRIENKNLRIDLLNLYDTIVENHILELNSKISDVAESYYKAYREFGGIRSKEDIRNDLIIVSAASLNNLDIVVSNDEKTMLAENAVRAYNLINSVINRRIPKFISYRDFKKLLRGESNELF